MKKLLYLAVATAIVAMTACGNMTKNGSSDDSICADTDSVAIAAAEADTAPPPAFLYYYSPENMVVLYWTGVERPDFGKEEDEDWAQEAIHSWEKQDRIRRNAASYTKLYYDTDVVEEVECTGEQLKNPDGGDLPCAVIHNQWNQGAGLTFAFKDPKNTTFKDVEYGGMFVLASDKYLKSRKPIEVKYIETDGPSKPMPADVIKKLEQKYKWTCERSAAACTFGGLYTYGVVQFQPRFNKVMALDVIADAKEDKLYIHEAIAKYDANEPYSIWNVDDDGEYFASNIVMAFEGPKGLDLCFTRHAPESITFGIMRFEGEELIRDDYASFYVYVDEGRPFWKRDLATCVKLYNADSPENRNNELCKWVYIDIDGDGQDEVWLCDHDEKNHAFFSRKEDTFKLLCTCDDRRSVKVYHNRISFSGPAGGPAWYYVDYLLKDSKIEHCFKMTEVYGEPRACNLDGKELSAEEGLKFRDSMPSQVHWLNGHYWNTFDN